MAALRQQAGIPETPDRRVPENGDLANAEVEDGTRALVDGRECIHFDGYWIRYYPPLPETLDSKKRLIESLSRRLFHHTEVGINTPGENLELARAAYEREQDPARRRVNGSMLAGALFNRATDIFTTIVDLQKKGIEISPDDELMRKCGQYFQEALTLGKTVKHYSGHEGIDELWGEPLKAFTMSIGEFYGSRYMKIAQTMRAIDDVAVCMVDMLSPDRAFNGIAELVHDFAAAAKLESETMRTDEAIFQIWPEFVARGESLLTFAPRLPPGAPEFVHQRIEHGMRLVARGQRLMTYLAGARVPMPKSTQEYLRACAEYREILVRGKS